MASQADWPAIIERIEGGDRAALLRLTNLIASLLSRMGAYRDGDSHEDLVQDIVLRLLRSWRRGAIEGSFVGYAWTVTRNRLIDVAKARQQSEERTSGAEPDEVLADTATPLHAPAASAEPDNRIDLRRAVESLSQDEREAVTAIYLEGWSYAEASERLGVPLGTLKRRQTAGLKALRKKMQVGGEFSASVSASAQSTRTAAMRAEESS